MTAKLNFVLRRLPNGLAGSTAALLLDHSHVRYEKYR